MPSTKTQSISIIHQYTLWKTQDLAPNLQKFNKHFNNSLKRTQSQGKIILTENGDISQMYTALDHESILASLNWLLNLHFRRRGGVVIPKDPDQKPYFSNCITEPESGYFLSKQQILNITTFDLNNIFFTCKSSLLRQIIGIAMGSPLSPALAILNCAYHEHLFHKFLESNHRTISPDFFSVRYMDDLLSFVVDFDCDFKHADCDKHPDGSCTEIHTIFHDLFHFYHERLTMEIEPHTGTFKFLESMITVKDNVISSQFYLRNYNRNQNRVTKNFLNTQHWDSYNNAPIKRALVLGTLYRILRFSDPLASTVLPVIAHWTVELRDHGYPAHVLHRSIRSLSSAIITRPLRGSISRLVAAIYNDTAFDLSRFPLNYG